MEVTKDNFDSLLPKILLDVADCFCVCLDFEFSGISNQQLRSHASSSEGGGLSLQKRYEEVKEAAEKYQILQVGLTFVLEDEESGIYTLKPYNIPLSPILDAKLDVERVWSYQSSAVEFLMSTGFRMDAPFKDGVPYISRCEEQQARMRALNRDNIADINLDTVDAEIREFVIETRREIDKWIKTKGDKTDYLNIPVIRSGMSSAVPTTLSKYHKRLVHQMVRESYPDFVTIGRGTFVQIIPYNKDREDRIQETRKQRVRSDILRQTGFRWVVEALVGGKIGSLDLTSHMNREGCLPAERNRLLAHANNIKKKLKDAQPVLVGHNLFADLVNFYRCFMGDLPDRVEDFQQTIHDLFPLVIDTKYMATRGQGSWKSASSLANLNDALKRCEKPTLAIDPEHTKYDDRKVEHEAGYDSLITAQLFLRLSAKLQQEKGSTKDDNDKRSTEAEEQAKNDAGKVGHDQRTQSTAGDSPLKSPKARSQFAHSTRFDLFRDEMDDDNSTSSEEVDDNDIEAKVKAGELVPRFDSKFWKEYGNTLRVFGTIEELCHLGTGADTELPQEKESPSLTTRTRCLYN